MPDARFNTFRLGDLDKVDELLEEERPVPLSDYDVRAILHNLVTKVQAQERRICDLDNYVRQIRRLPHPARGSGQE